MDGKAPTFAFCVAFMCMSVFMDMSVFTTGRYVGASRSLLQPAPLNTTSSPICKELHNGYLENCQLLLQHVLGWARAGNITTVTPGQIEQDYFATSAQPSAQCCVYERGILLNGCRCDGDVKRVSRSVGIPPGGLKAEQLYSALACNMSITMDTAPDPCPGEPATPAGR